MVKRLKTRTGPHVCVKCGGSILGDGYTSAMHCEFADPESYWYNAPDSNITYCDFEEPRDKLKEPKG